MKKGPLIYVILFAVLLIGTAVVNIVFYPDTPLLNVIISSMPKPVAMVIEKSILGISIVLLVYVVYRLFVSNKTDK